MASSGTTLAAVISLAIALTAYYLNRNSDNVLRQRLENVLSGLLLKEREAKPISDLKIAVGFGACEDLVVQAVDVLNISKYEKLFDLSPVHYDVINNLEQLYRGFAYFFIHGAAAERYVGNNILFEKLVKDASQVKTSRWTLGGNAPVIGSRFAKEGIKVLLGASLTERLKGKLHPNIQGVLFGIVTGSNLQKDDIHLILEYPTGQKWGPYQTQRANRFIVHNDRNNPTLTGIDEFQQHLKNYNADLLVISGLQMMDNFPFRDGVRLDRLLKVQQIMISQPHTARTHFEMASFSDETLLKDLTHYVIPFADSIGMNEQELTNLHTLLLYGNLTLVSDARPRIASVLDQMRESFRLLRNSRNNQTHRATRQLTRLHVHTLAYQAILTEATSSWKNSPAAVAKASLTAHRHTCGTRQVDVAKSQLLVDESFATSRSSGSRRMVFNAESPVVCWEEKDVVEDYYFRVCIAPVLVCTKVLQTAGGGDNISAAGL
uniref:Uncharacterized protein n=1 Tax=Strigamia maritima TaxID=126957 RepID=T1JDT0_STRMM